MLKRLFFVNLIFVLFCPVNLIETATIRNVHVFMQEELVNGLLFSSTIKSDNGKIEEQYYIDQVPVLKVDYADRLDEARLKELKRKREKEAKERRSQIDFDDQVQVLLREKIIMKLLENIQQLFDKFSHDALQPYILFEPDTVSSKDYFIRMKEYALSVKKEMDEFIVQHDIQSLQEIIDAIESWPALLQNCFRSSVKNAIKQSDDTADLKELLTLVSE